jgi:hypothetical protein
MTGKNNKNDKARRSHKKNNNLMGDRLGGAFPLTKSTLFRYSDIYALTEAGAGTGAYQQWRANDLYDPDFTGVGHQPMYFDQLVSNIGPYMYFTVPDATFRFRITNVSAFPVLVVMYPSMYSATPASRSIAVEKPLAWKKLLAPIGSAPTTTDKTYPVSGPALFGLTRSQFMTGQQGTYSSSSTSGYMTLGIFGVGGIGSIVAEVDVDYHAMLRQLGNESQS